MAQIATSEDAYRHFVEQESNDWLFGLICFAILEEQRIERQRHFTLLEGRNPDADEITRWYEQQPNGVLLRAREIAENVLRHYASDVVRTALADERQAIADGVIVGEIRMTHRFWPQFGIGVAAGLVSALVFAALLTVLAIVVFADASPMRIVQDHFVSRLGETNGQAGTGAGPNR